MNKLITLAICIFLFQASAMGQRGQEAAQRKMDAANLEYYDLVFKGSEKHFKATEAPAKWAKESIVMLAQKYHLSFFRNSKLDANSIKGVYRKRVLLQDKTAVEEFSQFYFQESETIKIKLIKKDGTKKTINTSKAIEVETEVPEFYSSNYQTSSYKKLAIPDLEVGDIIDYFVVFTENRNTTISFFSTLPASYPILLQEIIFDVDKLWSFYYDSFNNAPKFKQDPAGGIDINGRQRKIVKRFRLVDEDRDARNSERWVYSNTNDPMFKVMAVSPGNLIFRTNKRDEIANRIDVLQTTKKSLALVPPTTYAKSIKSKLKKNNISKTNKKELTNAIYYFMRDMFLDTYLSPDAEMRSDFFAKSFAAILEDNKVPASIVAAVPRTYGDLNDVVSDKEIVYGVYVPSTKEYYWPINNYHRPTDSYSILNGASAYQITNKSLNKRTVDSKKVVIPTVGMDKNQSSIVLDINIDSGFEKLNIKNQSTYTGVYRYRYSPVFLTFEVDYLKNDHNDMFPAEREEESEIKGKKRRERVEKERKEFVDSQKERQLELAENWFKSEFEIEEFKDFKVLTTGRTEKNPELKVEANFVTEELISKAGPNYILEVGKLIGGQVELDDEEIKERSYDIEFGNAKILNNTINIEIPAGYKVEGLDNLKFNVDHPEAGFISSGSLAGNTLTITSSKQYKKAAVKKENWSNVVEMLEAAYDFSQGKIVLKKK